MLMNLFSPFNPSSSLMNLNWTSIILISFMFPMKFHLKLSRLFMMFKMMMNLLLKELKPFTKNSHAMNLTLAIFLSIILMNLLGLSPHFFTSTAHLSFTLSMSLPLWLMAMIYGWTSNTKLMFSHLTPQNTPNALIPLMVLIETSSLLIRPFTLSIRLTTNMITGHLLLILLNSMLLSIPMNMLILLIPIQLIMITLESAVALIQAYIFTILIILYSSEIN